MTKKIITAVTVTVATILTMFALYQWGPAVKKYLNSKMTSSVTVKVTDVGDDDDSCGSNSEEQLN